MLLGILTQELSGDGCISVSHTYDRNISGEILGNRAPSLGELKSVFMAGGSFQNADISVAMPHAFSP
jgi:hypothetical protein